MSSPHTASARPTSRVSLWRTPRTRALLVVGVAAIVAGCVALAARIYTDVLWFREVNQESVFWTTLRWRLLAPAVTALGTTCFILANLAEPEHVGVDARRERHAPGDDRRDTDHELRRGILDVTTRT